MGYGTIVSREYTPIPSVETCPPYPGRIVLFAITLTEPDSPHYNSTPEAHASILLSFPGRIIQVRGRNRRSISGCLLGIAASQEDRALELARGGEPMHTTIIVTDGDWQLFEVRLPEHDGQKRALLMGISVRCRRRLCRS